MQVTQVPSQGQKDPLEKELATHSSILAWRIPWTEEPGGLQSMGSQRVEHDWASNTFLWAKNCSKDLHMLTHLVPPMKQMLVLSVFYKWGKGDV